MFKSVCALFFAEEHDTESVVRSTGKHELKTVSEVIILDTFLLFLCVFTVVFCFAKCQTSVELLIAKAITMDLRNVACLGYQRTITNG